MILPQPKTHAEYETLFSDSSVWEPVIAEISSKHRLVGDIKRGALGSNIVYRVGNVWIKLFPPIFSQAFAYEKSALKIVEGKTSFETPKLIETGMLDSWPYMILSHVSGVRIGDLWPGLSPIQKCPLAKQMAAATLELQKLEAGELISARVRWDDFIADRLNHSVKTQQMKGLEINECRKLEKFVSRFLLSDFQTSRPVYIHSDLTADHFLVSPDFSQVTGIIDYADSMTGHPEYDLAAIFCFLLKGDFASQRIFYQEWRDQLSPEKMLMWVILHKFSDLRRYFGDEHLARVDSFDQLGAELFVGSSK